MHIACVALAHHLWLPRTYVASAKRGGRAGPEGLAR
jgi:hypothetical protein